MINQIKTLLGVEVQLAQTKLENGTVIEAEEMAPGNEVFIVTEEEKIAMPVGEYELEDGRQLVVKEEGKIETLGEKKSDEPEEEELAEDDKEEKEEMEYATKQELAEVKDMIEEIKAMIKDKEEMSEEEQPVEEVTEPVEELSAVERVTHNPEVEQKKTIKLGTNRPMTTQDIVMAKIANIKK